MNKELKKLLARLEAQGFRIEPRSSGHIMVKAPDGVGMTVLALTGSKISVSNELAHLKRIGYVP